MFVLNLNELEEKLMSYNETAAQETTKAQRPFPPAESGYAEPCQLPITERFRGQLHRTRREARKAEQLNELIDLLEKHPDVARILDLVESLGRDY